MIQFKLQFALLVISTLSYVNCNCPFTCIDDRTFELFGIKIACMDGFFCHIGSDCKIPPCVDKYADCSTVYICIPDEPRKVKLIGLGEFECEDEHTVCDDNYQTKDCQPCVNPMCQSPAYFKCDEENPSKGIIDGFVEFECPAGKICNKKLDAPCEPCIKK